MGIVINICCALHHFLVKEDKILRNVPCSSSNGKNLRRDALKKTWWHKGLRN